RRAWASSVRSRSTRRRSRRSPSRRSGTSTGRSCTTSASASARRRACARFARADVARRLAAAVALTLVAAGLTGCEDSSQRGAREQVQAYLRRLPDEGGYNADGVHCTHTGRILLDPVRTTRAFCAAPLLQGGDCDWFEIDARKGRPPVIVLFRRSAGCVLPGE